MSTFNFHVTGKGALCALAVALFGCSQPEPRENLVQVPWRNDSISLIGPEKEHAFYTDKAAMPCAVSPKNLSKLCLQTLPPDGRIWMETEDGKDCWCPCELIRGSSPPLFDSLEAYDRMQVIQTFMKRRASWLGPDKNAQQKQARQRKHHVGPDNGNIHQILLPLPPPPALASGISNRDAVEMLSELFFDSYPIFTVYVDEASDYAYPYSFFADDARTWPGVGELPDRMKMEIDLPAAFLDDPAVHWQLIAFMFAHEIGHALGHFEVCNTASGLGGVSENNCDYWGANIGLRRVFPGRRGLKISRKAQAQLIAYETAWGTQDCGWGKPCPVIGCVQWGYPPVDCRGKNMKAARHLSPPDPCVRDDWSRTQPASCELNTACP